MDIESQQDLGSHRVNRSKLFLGMLLALIASLSIHVVMLQVLRIPFPDFDAVKPWAPFLNTTLAILSVIYVYSLARPRLARFPVAVRCLIVFALYAMLKESLRGIVMNGVVTTGWRYDIVTGLPGLAYAFILTSLIVLITPALRALWIKIAAAAILAGLMIFAVRPLLHALFAPAFKAVASFDHPEVYAFPYGWQVLVPAYITYAEPVIASTLIAALIWKSLSTSLPTRLLQFAVLILLMRGMLIPTLIYSFYSKLPLPAAMLSESQFLFETTALALLTGLAWQLSTPSGQTLTTHRLSPDFLETTPQTTSAAANSVQ